MAAIICPCPKDAFAIPISSTRCCPSGSFSRSLKFVSTTRESFGSPSSARAYMGQTHQYLLPALNVLTYHDPFAWHESKAGASYSAMYELAIHGRLFIELLDETIEETWGTKKMSFHTIKKPKTGEATLLKTCARQSTPLTTPIYVSGN